MLKKNVKERKLQLAKDTIRQMLPDELHRVGGAVSCGAGSACDCSSYGGSAWCDIGTNQGSLYCSKIQY